MKIVLCGIDNFEDPKSWSGTHHTLYKHFKEAGLLYGTINYSLKGNVFTRMLGYFHRKLSNRVFLRRGCRDGILNKYYEKAFLRGVARLNKTDEDLVFVHVTDYCIPEGLDPNIKHFVYIDSTLYGVLKYQPDDRLFKNRLSKKYINKSREYLMRAEGVFTQNEWSRESVINDYQIEASRVHNVGFGINLKPLEKEKPYDNSMLIVLRRGAEKKKGLLLLLEAFKIVKKKTEDAVLYVVGTELEPQAGVEYYENYPREKTIELFSKSSLYVMPATFEPNGITYLEGLANKSPIIGLNRCAVPEFTGYGKYGFTCDQPDKNELADLIINAFKDKQLLRKMGEEGQQFVMQKYKWDLVTREMIAIIGKSSN